MARFARLHAPGSVFHLISRFVNRDFRLKTEYDRELYLSGVPQSLQQSDWRPLAYALMSSHVHWVLLAGNAPLAAFIKPLHARFAFLHNQRFKRLGPVFANRPTAVLVEGNLMRLLAYVHNNPVRAGIVADPADSNWTSHREYIGKQTPSPWLDIAAGLRLAGLSDADRASFHDLVFAHAAESRSSIYSGGDVQTVRRRARSEVHAAVEVFSPRLTEQDLLTTVLRVPFSARTQVQAKPTLERLLNDVVTTEGLTLLEVRGGSKRRPFVHARRLFVDAATKLGYSLTEASAAVGLSVSAGGMLLRRAKASPK